MKNIRVNVKEAIDVSDDVSGKAQKQKLTLGISKDVIEKARAADINISEITEQLLTAMTFERKGNTQEDVVKAYQNFFDAIGALLGKYGTSIAIGQVSHIYGSDPFNEDRAVWTYELYKDGITKTGTQYNADGTESSLDGDDDVTLTELIPHMFEAKKILENLISALTSAAEHNKERLAQLDFAFRLVQTLKDENPGKKKK